MGEVDISSLSPNYLDDIMKPTACRILKIVHETQAEFTFRVEFDDPVRNGQFCMLSVPKVGEAPISISGKGDGYIEFTIRKVGRLTQGLFDLRESDYIYLRGPYGTSWPVELLENKNLIVVTSGTGLAPVRTTLMHFLEHPEVRKEVYLVAGFKDRNCTLFDADRKRFDECFHTVYPLSREKEKLPGYECGRVTAYLDRVPLETMDDYNFVITGAPAVIQSVTKYFIERGADPDKMWVSLERKMSCAIGKCGHCRINERYVCLEGAVFHYPNSLDLFD